MHTVLIPTDFSRNAWNAIAYSMEYFKEERCTFYFLHAYTPAFYRMDYIIGGPGFSAVPDKGLDISQAGLEKTVADVTDRYGNTKHTYEMLSAFNILSDEVNEQVKSKGIDLIVMGTQGATGAREIFLGSNAVYVIRKARVPVMVIPHGFTYRPPRRILFPADYLTAYRAGGLQFLIDMAKMHKSRVTVLHFQEETRLSEQQEENKTMLARSLQQLPYEMEEVQAGGLPEDILDFADRKEADMVVMINRKHSFLQRLLFPQNVDQVAFHVRVPLLVIPENSKLQA